MADERQNQPGNDCGKVGSDPDAAKHVGGKGDFGVPNDERHRVDREYTSENTKLSDPGASHPRAGESPEGTRVSGVGSPASGPGSGSGGDLDPDIIGVGTGGGVAASGDIDEPPGPDDAEGTSDDMASGPHAQGKNQDNVGKVGGPIRVKGSTVDRSGDDRSTNPESGADAANSPRREDDSFAGEISSNEATGQDARE